jgi:dihydrofolate synthase / folylpolyglutamate synthase
MLQEVLRELYARGTKGIRLGLEGMRESCVRLGSPERAFVCVHIAGTNGKGSTSAMVESVARAAGKRTGLYTSPHLCRFAERIRIDGAPISDDALASVLRRALDAAPELTFFEVATLAAFLAFRDAGVEFVVLEVGLGGRLDATNVIETPLACAITSIGFDHMNLLGHTLAAIAREKAGIAKAGVPLLLGDMPEEARTTIESYGKTVGAQVARAPSPQVDDDTFNFFFGAVLPLRGAFQCANYMLARRIALAAGFNDEACDKGLRSVAWPGRYEFVRSSDGPYLLDAAHNPQGAAAFLASLEQDAALAEHGFFALSASSQAPTRASEECAWVRDATTLVYGALADKAWAEALQILGPRFSQRVYTCPKGRPAADPAALAAMFAGDVCEEPALALQRARQLAGPGLVVVCGSVYLVGACRAHLLGLPMDPPIGM